MFPALFRRHHLATTLAFLLALTATAVAASARPFVDLRLQGVLVQHNANGAEVTTPVDKVDLKSGETIRYVVIATNSGTDAALKLKPTVRIPAGTFYEAGSASAVSHPEFSLDGGKTWSSAPTIKVQTPTGIVEKKADPATYTAIRWTVERPLDPHASVSYSYEVQIK